jgi:hypothetical protein
LRGTNFLYWNCSFLSYPTKNELRMSIHNWSMIHVNCQSALLVESGRFLKLTCPWTHLRKSVDTISLQSSTLKPVAVDFNVLGCFIKDLLFAMFPRCSINFDHCWMSTLETSPWVKLLATLCRMCSPISL